MFELEKTEYIQKLIDVTKSNSGISGPELAKAHMSLGEEIGKQLKRIEIDPNETTVVAILRGGIFFAQGIYFSLITQHATYAFGSRVAIVFPVLMTESTKMTFFVFGRIYCSCFGSYV